MHPNAHSSQTRLWLTSIAASVAVNAGVIVAVVLWTSQVRVSVQSALAQAVTKEEPSLVFLAPVMEALAPKPEASAIPEEKAHPDAPPAEPATSPDASRPGVRRPMAATTAEQESADAPSNPVAQGERNTRATSSAPASQGAPNLPSIDGKEYEDGRKPTTFNSDYRDGDEARPGAGDPETNPAASAPNASAPVSPVLTPSNSPTPQKTLPGTLPVDRSVLGDTPSPAPTSGNPAPAPQPPSAETKPQQDAGISTEAKPTTMEGSVTTIGGGAMDVEDTPRGRYTAVVTRAIERQWQAGLARNREYNTVGTVRVHVIIDPTGKVRKVEFMDEYGIGKVQKGFILSSIRDSKLPAMPAALSQVLKNQPFDLTISFIFGS